MYTYGGPCIAGGHVYLWGAMYNFGSVDVAMGVISSMQDRINIGVKRLARCVKKATIGLKKLTVTEVCCKEVERVWCAKR